MANFYTGTVLKAERTKKERYCEMNEEERESSLLPIWFNEFTDTGFMTGEEITAIVNECWDNSMKGLIPSHDTTN